MAYRALLLTLCFSLFTTSALALDVPELRSRVSDQAGMISPQVELRLEQALEEFERSDSTQVAILTIESLEGDSLEEFALRVASSWGLGQAQNDNGALLLVAKAERKIRIEVGYGLEGRLTDLLAGRIIDNEISPRFKRGDLDGGFLAGTAAIIEAVRGEYQGTDQPRKQKKRRPSWGWIALILFLGPGLSLLGGGRRSSHRRGGFWVSGGGFGGGFGGGGGFSGGGGGFGGGGASGGW